MEIYRQLDVQTYRAMWWNEVYVWMKEEHGPYEQHEENDQQSQHPDKEPAQVLLLRKPVASQQNCETDATEATQPSPPSV